jgi:hypothetical protein
VVDALQRPALFAIPITVNSHDLLIPISSVPGRSMEDLVVAVAQVAEEEAMVRFDLCGRVDILSHEHACGDCFV